jgi:HAD superfamily hydrolase (TIGR01549 family)
LGSVTVLVPVAQVLAGDGPILLDFDGPVCRVFAGYPAAHIAAELRNRLTAEGITVPAAVAQEDDPLEVLRWTGSLDDARRARQTEDALRSAELAAVASAEPTPFAREVIVAAHEADRRLAIVSNNSAAAIHAYIAAHRLTAYIETVVGRDEADTMKPEPEPIVRALHQLESRPADAVMIGDSPSDILSARAAGTRSIGYANRPSKTRPLLESGADAVVHSMADIATTLMASLPTV